ncbi:MAG TPA: class I SAM-dependent methyltransferase [Thiobacillaceae bacterium]|nr:class I SAM-dependent methyltransferase [Thiobacillaceae bacterium]
MHLTYRKTCRVCGSGALTPIIDIGAQYLQGSFLKPGSEEPPNRRIPTRLVRCNPMEDEGACGLLQLEHSVPPEVLYFSYWYRSGTNRTMREHLSGIAAAAAELCGKAAATVLDIGCNDGTLLRAYPDTFVKFGVDPSDIAQEIGAGIQVVQDVFPSAKLDHQLAGRKLDVVTSIAMFYDLESPVDFARAIREVLAPEGLWVFEMSYMPTMLEMNSYDTICHEHLEYYSLAVVENILRRAGLKLFRAELNNINGGSIRCFACHADYYGFARPEWAEGLRRLRLREFELELDTDRPYRNFQERINVHRDQLLKLLMDLKKQGKSIHIYGASTKGNTILQWCGIDGRLIDCAADRNPDKDGAMTLGTNIPIVSEEKSRALKPDYYLVLPWHFREEFIEREADMLRAGTRFIFPLPEIEIIGG